MLNEKTKIIVILGPTASGKSELAVKIALRLRSGQAKKYKGAEIISADSRQVYKGLDIGSGKITQKEMQGIPHYCIDVASPKKIFTAQDFKKLGQKAISDIVGRRKIPIICGGTGFYIDALLGVKEIPEIPPDWPLRKKLEKKTTEEMFAMLKKLDPKRVKDIKEKTEILVPISTGIHAKAEIKDSKSFIVNVGANVALVKDLKSTKEIIKNQIVEIRELQESLAGQLQERVAKASSMEQEISQIASEIQK